MPSTDVRNILQTHQERTIIKQAPDLVVYIDGLPYLVNNWTSQGAIVVNFNDYVTASSGAADVGTWIPGATVNLSIPNHAKAQFLGPGGAFPITTMSEIKVFTRGYYLTKNDETVYHRVFWGVIDNVNQVDNETTLEVTLACKGILRIFDLMQFNLSPAVRTSATGANPSITPFTSVQQPFNPVDSILQMFQAPLGDDYIGVDVFPIETIAPEEASGEGGSTQNVQATLKQDYVSKWAKHLVDLQKGLRLFGLLNDAVDTKWTARAADAATTAKPETRSEGGAISRTVTAQEALKAGYNLDEVGRYLPSFQLTSGIGLLQATVSTRLARVQEMVEVLGWEGYQDIDGSIVVKPPLYNLNPLKSSAATSDTDRNPFVINLDERIGADTYMEDEGQVRLTRAAVIGMLNGADAIQISQGPTNLTPIGVFSDPVLIRQFGIRTEGVKSLNYLGNNAGLLYAYAVSELAKTNRHWKTYTVTVPMRPELRLGFPIHIPWRDIMGYLENISWSYNRGGACTMTLTCGMIRQREMYGTFNTNSNKFVYTPVRNACLRWTKSTKDNPALSDSVVDTNATIATPVALRLSAAEKNHQLATHNASTVAGDPLDSEGCRWRIQNDTGLAGDKDTPGPSPQQLLTAGVKLEGDDGFTARYTKTFFVQNAPMKVDAAYCLLVQTTAMPYTDDEGYILARPFPWGRYITLEDALDTFTRSRKQRTGAILPFETNLGAASATTLGMMNAHRSTGDFLQKKTDAFILTGLGTPSTNGTTSAQVLTKLQSLADLIGDNTTFFTVVFPTAEDPNASGLTPNPNNQLATDAQNALINDPTRVHASADQTKAMNAKDSAAYAKMMVTPTSTP